jgi:hypothetical protein
VHADYIARWETLQVGGREHLEYWIPTVQLEEFNENIVADIRVIDQYGVLPD